MKKPSQQKLTRSVHIEKHTGPLLMESTFKGKEMALEVKPAWIAFMFALLVLLAGCSPPRLRIVTINESSLSLEQVLLTDGERSFRFGVLIPGQKRASIRQIGLEPIAFLAI